MDLTKYLGIDYDQAVKLHRRFFGGDCFEAGKGRMKGRPVRRRFTREELKLVLREHHSLKGLRLVKALDRKSPRQKGSGSERA